MSNIIDFQNIRMFPHSMVALINNKDTAIVVDDNCYVICNWNGKDWGYSAWIFPEAIEAIKKLPANPNEAVILNPPIPD